MQPPGKPAPLAERLRPRSIGEVIGQRHLPRDPCRSTARSPPALPRQPADALPREAQWAANCTRQAAA